MIRRFLWRDMTALLDCDELGVRQLFSEAFAYPMGYNFFVGSPHEKSRDIDFGNSVGNVLCSADENAAACGESSIHSGPCSEWKSIRVDHF